MKKVRKLNSRGFTLIEMVLVIAIIVILAAVMVMSVGDYLGRARNAASSLADHRSSIYSVTQDIDDEMHR